ncbi:MAG TPA: HAMP domain-containing sensor histidine kinase [Gemmatimonadales bacterium]|jgi:signal transduction histidine kinase
MNRLHLTRSLQVGFLVLLAICTAQLAYWLADEVTYTAAVRTDLREAHHADAEAAQVMLRAGAGWNTIAATYPDLTLGTDSVISVKPATLEALDAQRFHRLNRYAWEGGFFLAVLLAAMAVVYRALRNEAVLRARQEHFLDAVSHELKSPLASLKLSAETLAMRDPPPERRAELVRRMLADLRRLERMDANVLDVTRLEAGSPSEPATPVVLSHAVAAVVDELGEVANDAGVTVTTDVPPALTALADEDRVQTVLRNLLHNAIRATTSGGSVEIRAAAAGTHVRLEVRDNGIGFPPDAAPRLFTKFYRIEGNEPARMGGTGLGLYLVRRCVDLDNGSVTASSAGAGQGAVFAVVWPQAAGIFA